MTVYCEDCDNVHSATRSKDPWKWRCMKCPTETGYKFVSRSYSPEPPYFLCGWVNEHGLCQYFTPLRTPPEK